MRTWSERSKSLDRLVSCSCLQGTMVFIYILILLVAGKNNKFWPLHTFLVPILDRRMRSGGCS
ncbi:hypothetical protein BJX65DRAFT_273122 [Aspergillus insuetus]